MGYKHNDPCLKKVADDEPIFVLRAKDKLAPMIVLDWARAAEGRGCSEAKTEEARKLAGLMINWQRKHGAKYPD